MTDEKDKELLHDKHTCITEGWRKEPFTEAQYIEIVFLG